MKTIKGLDNPYWEQAQRVLYPAKFAQAKRHLLDGSYGYGQQYSEAVHAEIQAEVSAYSARRNLVREYSWAIPDPEALSFVAYYCQPKVVEMGCGTGYWLYLLEQLGLDVIGYDAKPPSVNFENNWHSPYDPRGNGKFLQQPGKEYIRVQHGLPEVLKYHEDRTLFLCWPPYDDSMAQECLTWYSGNRIVFIGESEGGCTADDLFFALLDERYEEIASHSIEQWPGIHDHITVWERK